MSCAPLTFPPEWKAVVDRHFLLGVPIVGPQERVFKAVSAQLQTRGPECWAEWGAEWGPEQPRLALAQFVSAALGKATGWPKHIFVPADPFALVAWNHHAVAIDHLEVEEAFREIERHVGFTLGSRTWEALSRGLFGAVIDRLLR
jgi:hypothetical protein